MFSLAFFSWEMTSAYDTRRRTKTHTRTHWAAGRCTGNTDSSLVDPEEPRASRNGNSYSQEEEKKEGRTEQQEAEEPRGRLFTVETVYH